MGRIKPQALLLQSKRKKGPSRIAKSTIFACNALLLLLFISFIGFRRHRSKQIKDHESFDQESGVSSEQPQFAILNTTKGLIYLELFGDFTPRTVENFVTHSRNGYYDRVQFHRVIRGFMIQGGDPKGDGTGGESIWGGYFADEFDPSLKHEPFVLSMANHGPNTNGAQFFITTVATPHLDKKHTVFGRVVKGHEIVKDIESVETDERDRPKTPVFISNITIAQEI